MGYYEEIVEGGDLLVMYIPTIERVKQDAENCIGLPSLFDADAV